ncbi:MAG: ATP-binding protein [Phormidesmis sp.]
MNSQVHHVLSKLNPNRGLKARMAFATVGIVLLLSVLLSFIVGHISRDRIQNDRGKFLASLSFQMANKLDRDLFELHHDIQILASLDAIRAPDVDVASKRALFEKLQTTYPDYAWIGLADTKGNIVASTGRLLEGRNAAKQPWFQQSHQHPFVGDIHEAALLADLPQHKTGELLHFAYVAAPVTNQNGAFEGVLGAYLSWSLTKEVQTSLSDPLETQSRVEVFVLSEQGRVLLGPEGFQDESLELPSVDAGQSGKMGYQLETWPDGIQYLTAFTSSQGYRDYPGLGWITLVRQPAQVAFGPARAMQAQVFVWGGVLGGLCAIGSWLNARQIVNPILRLTIAVNRIQQGDSQVAVPILRGQGELAKFSESLSQLVQTLNAQQQNLAITNQKLQQEIDERKRSEEKIRRQAALLDIATDAIFVRGLDGVIQYWNRSAERLYGWSASEVCGKESNTLINRAANADVLREAFQSVLEQNDWQGELKKMTKAGQEVIVDSRWTLIRDQANEPTAILTVDTDITQAKQLETQFLRAQRLESLGTLASGIAHDLNNVLTPILGAAAILPMSLKNIDETSESIIKTLDVSARRASDMVKQILSFARGGESQRYLIQVAHVLKELRQVCNSTFPKNIVIEMNLGSELWPVSADATQLHQICMNLCVNARDAMPDGGTLTLSAENRWIDQHFQRQHLDAKIGPYVQISVNDTGTGMSPEVIERIFDPFFTTKEIGKGTGLGLFTSLGIVKNHGGFLIVCSETGKGTQFQLYLPAQENSQTQAAIAVQAQPGHGEMVLVVDDEISIREMTKIALESYNYRIITAENGNQAIAQYAEHAREIRVVLMDMMMPSLGGKQAIDELKKIVPTVKIISTSGSIIHQDLPNVEVFLPKPYSLNELLMAIHTVIYSN